MCSIKKSTLALTLVAAFAANVRAGSIVNGPMSFNSIEASAYAEVTIDPVILNSEPWVVPEGYVQSIVSDETDLDIHVANDWHESN